MIFTACHITYFFQPKQNENADYWSLTGEPVVEAHYSDDDASLTSSIYFNSNNLETKMDFPKKCTRTPRKSLDVTEKAKRNFYTSSEEMEIVQWIIDKQRFSEISGIALWKDMERDGILANRSHQSMKERFKKHILPKIREFDISQKDTNSFELHGLKKDRFLFSRKNPNNKNGTSPGKKKNEKIDVKKEVSADASANDAKNDDDTPSSADVCDNFGLNDVDLEYTDADYQKLTTYKLFWQKYLPKMAAANPGVENPKMMMLLAAKWREFQSL